MDQPLQLLALASVLVCIAPLALIAVGAIQATKAQQPVWPWLCISFLCITALAVTTLLSLMGLLAGLFPRVILGFDGGDLLPVALAALLVAVGSWSVWFVGRRWASGRSRR